MVNSIKPIETYYKGYRFRSRLEAKWAVFFDTLGIKWEYEAEGVDLGNGLYYLPDFYLPDSKQFFEVKGVMNDVDQDKVNALIDKGYSVTVGYSDGKFVSCDLFGEETDGKRIFVPAQDQSWLGKCYSCGKYFFTGSIGTYECQCCGYYDGDHSFKVMMASGPWGTNTKLWDCARQARFEHGEKG